MAAVFHTGRLIDHVHLRVADLRASQRFYTAVLDALGIESSSDQTHLLADELWIDVGPKPSSIHLAFQAKAQARFVLACADARVSIALERSAGRRAFAAVASVHLC